MEREVAVTASEADGDLELVPVFQTSNEAHILLARSLLDSAEIEFLVRGEHLQDFFSWGRFPAGVNLVMGPVTFEVRAEDAEDARRLLADIREAPEDLDEPDEDAGEGPS